jgi:hypothetical protein
MDARLNARKKVRINASFSDRMSEYMPERMSEYIYIYTNAIYPYMPHILPDGMSETMSE